MKHRRAWERRVSAVPKEAPGDGRVGKITEATRGEASMRKDFMFTSESVTEGHPDKLCDQISDAIVDRFLQQDPASAIIAECGVSTAIVFIAARFAANASVDIPDVARQTITLIGYEQPDFNGKTCSVITSLQEMSAD